MCGPHPFAAIHDFAVSCYASHFRGESTVLLVSLLVTPPCIPETEKELPFVEKPVDFTDQIRGVSLTSMTVTSVQFRFQVDLFSNDVYGL